MQVQHKVRDLCPLPHSGNYFLCLELLILELSLVLFSIGRNISTDKQPNYSGATTIASYRLRSDNYAQSCYLPKELQLLSLGRHGPPLLRHSWIHPLRDEVTVKAHCQHFTQTEPGLHRNLKFVITAILVTNVAGLQYFIYIEQISGHALI